jgi:hypothetical protein
MTKDKQAFGNLFASVRETFDSGKKWGEGRGRVVG